ncbi:MAG: methyltransferase domain-containing protein [Planctomycetes bacterium]|nr:methyltransferase domain-containing protein [Planctomycetota bacterium]MBI3846336.1 methyltransferase domain-containing protein [Planctomycetota bacterium]
MKAPQATPTLSPNRIFGAIQAYQQAAAIRAAIDLDLFTAIAGGATTQREIATRIGVAERGARILSDYLVVAGFLTKESGRYGLAPDAAAFLDRRSPAYVGASVEFIQSPTLISAYGDLTAAVRKGGTAMSNGGATAPEHPVWAQFARSMSGLAAIGARNLAERLTPPEGPALRVLDIAAGHGLYGISIAQRNPRAEVVALDWPHVLEVAKEFASRAGVGDRFRTLPGSAFDVDYGKDYDVVLLTNFLHHFDAPTCEKLARKVHGALRKGGRAVTLEFVPNEDRVTPVESAGFALSMLAATPAGDAYTFAEIERFFRTAGFERSEMFDLPQTPQRVVISHR